MSRYLVITEGKNPEIEIFTNVLTRYGYKVYEKLTDLPTEEFGQFTQEEYKNNLQDSVVVIQGPRNRLNHLLNYYKKNEYSLEKIFQQKMNSFQGIFLLYDVDHVSVDELNEAFNKFNDESEGLLLVSSPCIEVLGDANNNRRESKFNHLKEYKSLINSEISNKYNCSCAQYVIDHFDELALYFLNKNTKDFNETNVMEHPKLVIDKINKENIRVNGIRKEDTYVIYKYYTTVVYVLIACLKKLNIQIDNSRLLKAFFESNIKNKSLL